MHNLLMSEKVFRSFQKPSVEHIFYIIGFILIIYLSYEQNNISKSALTPIFILCLSLNWLLASDGYLIIYLKHKPNYFLFASMLIFLSLCTTSIYLYGLVGLVISFSGFAFALIYLVATHIRKLASK